MTKPNSKRKKNEKKDHTFYEMTAASNPSSEVDLSNEDSPGRKMINQQLHTDKK